MMVHPTVEGAADFPYEIWPNDESFFWIERFGMQPGPIKWRKTNRIDGIPHFRILRRHQFSLVGWQPIKAIGRRKNE